ncbi:hypothetical protein GCM10020219_008010 [Nonomuraea dietziae]
MSRTHAGKPDIKHLNRWLTQTNRLRTEGTDTSSVAASRSHRGLPPRRARATLHGAASGRADG